MSEETQQVEAQEAEAPLANVLQNDQEEAQAEAPIAIHDDQSPRTLQMMMKYLRGQTTTLRSFGMKMD